MVSESNCCPWRKSGDHSFDAWVQILSNLAGEKQPNWLGRLWIERWSMMRYPTNKGNTYEDMDISYCDSWHCIWASHSTTIMIKIVMEVSWRMWPSEPQQYRAIHPLTGPNQSDKCHTTSSHHETMVSSSNLGGNAVIPMERMLVVHDFMGVGYNKNLCLFMSYTVVE